MASKTPGPRTQQTYEELLAYAQEYQLPALVSMTLNRMAILACNREGQVRGASAAGGAWKLAQTVPINAPWPKRRGTGPDIGFGDEPMRALAHGEQALELARAIADKELEARSLASFGALHLCRRL